MENNRNLIILAAIAGIVIIVVMIVMFRGDDSQTTTEEQATETTTEEVTGTDSGTDAGEAAQSVTVTVTEADESTDAASTQETSAAQTGHPADDWDELTPLEKLERNPLECDLETQIMYAEDGSCHDKTSADNGTDDADNTDNTDNTDDADDTDDGSMDEDEPSMEEQSQASDETDAVNEETSDEVDNPGIEGVTVTRFSRYTQDGVVKTVTFDVDLKLLHPSSISSIRYYNIDAVNAACGALDGTYYLQLGSQPEALDVDTVSKAGRYRVNDVLPETGTICVYLEVETPGQGRAAGTYGVGVNAAE